MSVTRSLLLVQELDSHLVKRFLHHVSRNAPPSGRLVGSVRGARLRSLHCGAPALQGLGGGSTPPNAETITSFRSPASYRRVHAALATPQEEELFEPSHGPDQVLPARSHKCWHPDGAVTLTMDEEGPGARAPMSVHSLLQTAVLAHPQQPALAVHRDDAWKYWNYAEYYAASATAAKAFIRLGLERFHSVCIMGANSPEWVIANNAPSG
ncbi:long-chain-fatty-acid--CoA ligase ACSBG2-like [Hyalella azteca]|uniref:Long-chain-fatty-acid--CoA ligase ACSBG2-like n=1 Tax=Hyalella azteca TaxID=294128 RepID=A0A979FNJ9_HYAAZ|nr:long-chain-fatty-acid--CoA ligase ACSBG2-like [Hyalella azteca]